jgi:hypothetical protein
MFLFPFSRCYYFFLFYRIRLFFSVVVSCPSFLLVRTISSTYGVKVSSNGVKGKVLVSCSIK